MSEMLIWLALAVCITQSATLSGLNLAVFSVSRLRLEAAADAGDRDAGRILALRRDAHYTGAARLGHGAGYRYPHDDPAGWVVQRYLPEGLEPGDIYRPGPHGEEPDLPRWRGDGAGE